MKKNVTKKIVTMHEFYEYYQGRELSMIGLCSENQSWYSPLDYEVWNIRFEKMRIQENPDLVVLSLGKSQLVIRGIKCVKIETGAIVLGDIVTLHCYGLGTQPYKKYTLIVS